MAQILRVPNIQREREKWKEEGGRARDRERKGEEDKLIYYLVFLDLSAVDSIY